MGFSIHTSCLSVVSSLDLKTLKHHDWTFQAAKRASCAQQVRQYVSRTNSKNFDQTYSQSVLLSVEMT